MKIWVDDIRPAPEGWVWCKSYKEAITLLRDNEWEVVSLDHDLADFRPDREMTGYDVLMYIVSEYLNGDMKIGEVRIHTQNPVARERMLGTIKRYL